jgi:tetratricopeptide (TPR) repeat protein
MAGARTANFQEACRLAFSHHEAGRNKQAASILKRILEVSPGHGWSLYLMGKIASHRNKRNEALDYFYRLEKLESGEARLLYGLGLEFEKLGKHEQAMSAYGKSLKLVEKDDELASLLYDIIAKDLQSRARHEEAIRYYTKALELNPDNHHVRWQRSFIHLSRGDFEQGWKDFESRIFIEKQGNEIREKFGNHPQWRGEDFRGKTLLVREDFGIGDLLQFLRFLPMVKLRGGKVILAVRPRVLGLLAAACGPDEIISPELAQQRSGEYDLQATMMSLPFLLDIRLDNLPVQVPYLHADPARSEAWRERLGKDSIRVGLVWTANPENTALAGRSMALSDLAPCLDVPGTTLYGLQYGATAAEADRLTGSPDVINLGDEVADFGELAAVVADMDLVITVDTAMAHLAGAMGRPVWVLLPYAADWRWLLDRDDSPWYPTMRLFRQEQPGEWGPVFLRLHKMLCELAGQHGR